MSHGRVGTREGASSGSTEPAGVPSRRTFLREALRPAALLTAGLLPTTLFRAPLLRGAAFPAALLPVAAGAGAGVASRHATAASPQPGSALFKLSLAQWSLHKEIAAGRLDPFNFAKTANGFGLDAIEYVSSFYRSHVGDKARLADLKRRAAGEGVCSLLIMVDGEGALGDPDESARRRAIDNHRRWVEAAAYLGCHAIRVNAESRGTEAEQVSWLSDGLRRLCQFSDALGIDILVENHQGLSAKASWLVEVVHAVGHPRCGTLPDFGNFQLAGGAAYDRYQGVRELMPFARAVSAKAYDFDARGDETRIDYLQMLQIVTAAGYHGYVGIEYEGSRLSEPAGIARTKQLLERVRAKLAARRARR